MLTQLRDKAVPQSLTGHMLVDAYRLPRVFATGHMMTWGAISSSTKTARLRAIDSVYRAFEKRTKEDCLDDLISRQEINRISDTLEAWYFELSTSAQDRHVDNKRRWKYAIEFIVSSVEASSPAHLLENEVYQRRLSRIRAFGKMKLGNGTRAFRPRSIPDSVIDEVFSIIDPTSEMNPFRTEATAFRNFTIVLMAYELGLRRGEMAMLPVDAIKEQFDAQSGQRRRWITIDSNHYERDERSTRPSLKTKTSRRVLPISRALLQTVNAYRSDFRGKPEHSFLLNSSQEKPLALPSVNLVFAVLSNCLCARSRSIIHETCGKATLSPHDFRHTSAVLRMKRLILEGKSMQEAIEDLRVFYGWSKNSDMPQHYARAYFEGELTELSSERMERAIESARNSYEGNRI